MVNSRNDIELLAAVEPKVTSDMQDFLAKEFYADEVAIAVKQMHATKTSELDGMAPIFFQNYWNTIFDMSRSWVATDLGLWIFKRLLLSSGGGRGDTGWP